MTEHDEQARLVSLACSYEIDIPELHGLFSIPNGGWRHPATAARLKAEGLRAGIPDLFLAVPRGGYCGMFIEMKVAPNKPTEQQRACLDWLGAHGYFATVCYGCDDAWQTICEYLEVPIDAA